MIIIIIALVVLLCVVTAMLIRTRKDLSCMNGRFSLGYRVYKQLYYRKKESNNALRIDRDVMETKIAGLQSALASRLYH